MVGENGTPITPEWECEPRPWCAETCTCTTASESAFMHNAGERLGENIVLGTE